MKIQSSVVRKKKRKVLGAAGDKAGTCEMKYCVQF